MVFLWDPSARNLFDDYMLVDYNFPYLFQFCRYFKEYDRHE